MSNSIFVINCKSVEELSKRLESHFSKKKVNNIINDVRPGWPWTDGDLVVTYDIKRDIYVITASSEEYEDIFADMA